MKVVDFSVKVEKDEKSGKKGGKGEGGIEQGENTEILQDQQLQVPLPNQAVGALCDKAKVTICTAHKRISGAEERKQEYA